MRTVVADCLLVTGTDALADASRAIVDAMRHAVLAPEDTTSTPPTAHRWVVRELDEHTPRRRLALQLQTLLLTPPAPRIGMCCR